MIVNNRLGWDGSFLGKKNSSTIEKEQIILGDNHAIIALNKNYINCILEKGKKEKIAFIEIVESMLELFGLERRGYHTIEIGDKKHLMFFTPIGDDGEVIVEKKLNKVSADDDIRKSDYFVNSLRKLLVFCNIMRLKCSGESRFLVRIGENYSFPLLCFYKLDNNGTGVSKSMMKKLFKDVNYSEILRDIVENKYGKIDENNITEFLCNLREDIEAIICLYDRTYIWYSKCIIENIIPHLLL